MLLAGCVLVFRKRAGIVLLHGGIMLVMANELVVYGLHDEDQMQIAEGQTVNYVTTFARSSWPWSIPRIPRPTTWWSCRSGCSKRDSRSATSDCRSTSKWSTTSRTRTWRTLKPGEENPATAGLGLKPWPTETPAGTGTDAGGKVDMPAAYVKLVERRRTSRSAPTWFGDDRVHARTQKVEVGGKTYDLALRFKRNYKPYSVHARRRPLRHVPGHQTPKNYSSDSAWSTPPATSTATCTSG